MTPRQTATAPLLPLSIAVLPFAPSSNTPADAELADRLTRDVTTTLGQWRMAHVASRGLVAAYKSKPTDERRVGGELGVRHLVEGEIGHVGERLVVSVRVIDTPTGAQTWSDRMEFDGSLRAAEPDAVLIRTASRVRSAIVRIEMRRAVEHPLPDSALSWVLRGHAAQQADSWLSGARDARKLYDEALRLDPNFVPALLGRANTLHWDIYEDPLANRARMAAEMDSLSQRALALDGRNAEAWSLRGDALGWLERWEEAIAADEKGRAIDPTDLVLWDNAAWLNYAMGRPAESLAIAKRIIAIDPPGVGVDWYYMCRGYLMLGQYGDSVPACEKAAALDARSWQTSCSSSPRTHRAAKWRELRTPKRSYSSASPGTRSRRIARGCSRTIPSS